MASLRAIRTRIKSVKGTQKITAAMKMVAAAKLRRAQDAALRARPYAEAMDALLSRLSVAGEDQDAHPLLQRRPVKKVELVVLTSDRGLCGGFNSNIVRRLQRFFVDHGSEYERIQISTVGRRGRDYAKKRGFTIRKDWPAKVHYGTARGIADDVSQEFVRGDIDAVFLLYNRFQSALVQRVTLTQILPAAPGAGGGSGSGKYAADFLYEPTADQVLEALLPQHLAVQIWQAMLESEAGFLGAQMTAMDSATKNAKEMVARLTLQYNRARQAAITKELMEIVSGAEALKS